MIVLVLLLGSMVVAVEASQEDCDFWCKVDKFFSGPVVGKVGVKYG